MRSKHKHSPRDSSKNCRALPLSHLMDGRISRTFLPLVRRRSGYSLSTDRTCSSRARHFCPGYYMHVSVITRDGGERRACDRRYILTSSWTQRKWTERQNLLFSTVAPGIGAVLAVSARYTCRGEVADRARIMLAN
jgi:hypothetical protein